MANKLVRIVDFLCICLSIVSMYVLTTDESRSWRIVAGLSIMLVVFHFAIRDGVEEEEND